MVQISLPENSKVNKGKYFKDYDFHNLYRELLNFCTIDLSAFYFDIRKDTLYCDPINSEKRKFCVTILNIMCTWCMWILRHEYGW